MALPEASVSENLGEISRILAECEDAALIEDFFRGLFTPAETADIAARWALLKELSKGVSQREIARRLRVSLCKITRGSRELKKENSALRKFLPTEHCY